MSAERTIVPPSVIVATTDFSEVSEVGLRHAAMLAEVFDARLVVAVNLNLPERAHVEPLAEEWGVDTVEAARELIVNLMARLAPELGVEAVVVELDTPAEGILWVLDEVDADLVVIAKHGRSGLGRWLLGSVTDKIVHSAHVPVLVVAETADEPA